MSHSPPHKRALAAIPLALGLAACDDSAPKGDVVDAAPYLNSRDRNTLDLPDGLGPSDAGGGSSVDPRADAAGPVETDALQFIDGSSVEPTDDAGEPPPEDDAEVEPPPGDDARVTPPPREDARVPPPPERDAAVEPPPPPPDDRCAVALRAASFDFEAGPQGFTHGASDGVVIDWPLDSWAHGRPQLGPGECVDQGACWGTGLDENLVQCQRAELVSPSIDLTACAGQDVELVFDHWYEFWAGTDGIDTYYDGGTVEISTDGRRFEPLGGGNDYPGVLNINPSIGFDYSCVENDNFHVNGLPGFVQASAGWEEAHFALGAYSGDRIILRFAYATGVSVESFDPAESQLYEPPGWFVDRLRFEVR